MLGLGICQIPKSFYYNANAVMLFTQLKDKMHIIFVQDITSNVNDITSNKLL